MIAFKKNSAKGAVPMNVPGAATSAAKMQSGVGIREMRHGLDFWIPGEGWVRWAEIERQVAAAHLNWLRRRVEQGFRLWDFRDYWANERENDMALADGRGWRFSRIEYLRAWKCRHAQLESIAGLPRRAAA